MSAEHASGSHGGADLPQAVIKPERRLTAAWIVPLLALLLAAWLGLSAWRQRGTEITVQLPEGHGLKIGDSVRYRGITVGEVRDARLSDDLAGVVVTVALQNQASELARAGTRFWVVRPQLGVTGVQGIETLIGPRYLAVVPATFDGDRPRRQRDFVGLVEPPVVASIAPGDLEVVLEASRRGSLRPGGAVTYRQLRVGTVLSVGLASDGSAIEARVHILEPYRSLVRERTRFWDAGGFRTDVSLTGLSVELDSVESLVVGAVALATPSPDDAGDMVRTGHRFMLRERPQDEWLEWTPQAAIGSALLPPGATLPQPRRAAIRWKQGFLIKKRRSLGGWVLPTTNGLLGPTDLLTAERGPNTDPESVVLEVGGEDIVLTDESAWSSGRAAMLPIAVTESPWPAELVREATEPEDCLAIGDATAAPMSIAASRLMVMDESSSWTVDPGIALDASWHGAAVVSRADGHLIGIVLVDDDDVHVALIRGWPR